MSLSSRRGRVPRDNNPWSPKRAGASPHRSYHRQKNVKRAHERNRIKRLAREYFRLHQHELPSMDFVVLVRRGR